MPASKKGREKLKVLPIVALCVGILGLVLSVIAVVQVNSERTEQCSVLGVDMATQRVTLECK